MDRADTVTAGQQWRSLLPLGATWDDLKVVRNCKNAFPAAFCRSLISARLWPNHMASLEFQVDTLLVARLGRPDGSFRSLHLFGLQAVLVARDGDGAGPPPQANPICDQLSAGPAQWVEQRPESRLQYCS